ncbi:hypothetical protein [Alloalcanivorax mobilis]|uniref:hypothetical protein n=1 Tax=Alloalcanivorax mobilis TaxID=2019569 RepID=UPI000B5B1366|nr:hypothetical protein [Alloalcanivorax mobilis]ASK35657.1 hypothetical protein CEK62_15345 [Alcanivorax sp. N3-2A]|tara:strand:+ start:4687 stop:6057 length:1371 start_codon:yes stop_codon:yes gene_type:complete
MALKWTAKSNGALANSANVQPKLSLQRLGQAIGLCSVVGAAALLSPTAHALKTDFGMEYRATAFASGSDAFETLGGSDSDTGFGQLIRVKGNFLDEETGISVYTSVELAGDRWTGDDRKYGTTNDQSFNSTSRGDNVRLDLGYLQIPVGHTVFRVGRQATSYNNCFLVCDDRRDRIIMIQPFSKTLSVVLGYDRRQDSTPFEHQDNGDMMNLGVITKLGDWDLGLLYVKWMNNYEGTVGVAPTPYVLQNVDLFSGYLSGDLLGLAKATVGFNYFMNGNVENPVDNVYFTDKSPSAYLRLTQSFGVIDAGLQYVTSKDGGLISPGFDTYSSLINSNPEATASATSMYRMGGTLGREDFDENLIIGKATWNLTPKFAITGAVGNLDIDNGTDSDDSMVYDLQLSYQANKALRTWLSVGMIEKNDAGALTGNDLVGSLAGADFSDDDVKAASLNMSVNF